MPGIWFGFSPFFSDASSIVAKKILLICNDCTKTWRHISQINKIVNGRNWSRYGLFFHASYQPGLLPPRFQRRLDSPCVLLRCPAVFHIGFSKSLSILCVGTLRIPFFYSIFRTSGYLSVAHSWHKSAINPAISDSVTKAGTMMSRAGRLLPSSLK